MSSLREGGWQRLVPDSSQTAFESHSRERELIPSPRYSGASPASSRVGPDGKTSDGIFSIPSYRVRAAPPSRDFLGASPAERDLFLDAMLSLVPCRAVQCSAVRCSISIRRTEYAGQAGGGVLCGISTAKVLPA
ncbi:unnamed protein product [Diplocarpon coronariae]